MKNIVFVLCLLNCVNGYSQCNPPSNIYTTNINFYNALANWTSINTAHHYKIRYKIIGNSSWEYKNNIDSLLTKKLLNPLLPLSDYIWQIRSYCDSTGNNFSSWSVTDTFTTHTNNCPHPSGAYTSNINYNNALANWNVITTADRYKIQYRVFGTSSWSNLGPVYNPTSFVQIPLLQPSTTYEWQVMAFHDTTTLMASLWSPSDTFTTPAFIPSPFNPISTHNLSVLECNSASELAITISQTANEPDIENVTITSDAGYFNINSLNIGDSVGYSFLTAPTQNIYSTLKVGMIPGQNYAIINSFDSTGALIGFFGIENLSSGIKITSTSPNDGNNYTSGFTSKVFFTNVFTTPSYAGPLCFFTEIISELNDQFSQTDTIQISCANPVLENNSKKNLVKIYDFIGSETKFRKKVPLLYIYDDNSVKKIMIIDD